MSSVSEVSENSPQTSSFYAAVAKTTARSIGLYFSRPVRLFRPSKISGWLLLKTEAASRGKSISPSYLLSLVRDQGLTIIPKHFIPPILVNAVLGTVLWTAYSESYSVYEKQLNHGVASALGGATAGAFQALAAAPAENLRIALEGGTHSWSRAWKEVFRYTAADPHATKKQNTQEARAVREWMKDVREMAGYGWSGWRWGLAKDMCGFAVFFMVFDYTRRVASTLKSSSQKLCSNTTFGPHDGSTLRRYTPSMVNGLTLVTGGALAGLSYELICRPFDVARKVVHHHHIVSAEKHSGRFTLIPLIHKFREEGFLAYFRDPHTIHDHSLAQLSVHSRRMHHILRTISRVGPWGIGFLAWEIFGSRVERSV